MAAFESRKYRSPRQQAAYNASFQGRFIRAIKTHHFMFLGLPFISVVVGGAYMLSFFTQVRYEQHDRHVTAVSEDEALSVVKGRRKVDMKEEYYVSVFIVRTFILFTDNIYSDFNKWIQRIGNKLGSNGFLAKVRINGESIIPLLII